VSKRSQVRLPAVLLSVNNVRQVVQIHERFLHLVRLLGIPCRLSYATRPSHSTENVLVYVLGLVSVSPRAPL